MAEEVGVQVRALGRDQGRDVLGPESVAGVFVLVVARPRVVAVVSVCVTSEVDDARARLAAQLSVAGELPAYRAMLDRQGLAGPEDVAVLGDEVAVERSLRRFVEAGATELVVVPFGTAAEQERTRKVLAALNSR
ncbi:hypothetical protein SAMN02982929_05364 [Saccharopolyspora kobensis]|uniref:Luciferase-like monooxygenase n=1 Tax=Saccharopolyspora kobensis TaxID=146035 RepID=A0A1H6E044_9PSEU|nr:hypothetical protein [Saccharopolyspora kobensis]SEG90960.1 hypothetical protein SAMN02982929_05364 [Saccharopolyspora kobensis]SFD95162.1 hypothetical protein SAMN05216506_107340 [Saccharopolyspora kobensis]